MLWIRYKPWTVSQADPWDVAARAKWGEKPAKHGVGMSQMGAAYAASAGVSCADILRFYYPGTVVAGEYGEGEKSIGWSHPYENKGLLRFSLSATAPIFLLAIDAK